MRVKCVGRALLHRVLNVLQDLCYYSVVVIVKRDTSALLCVAAIVKCVMTAVSLQICCINKHVAHPVLQVICVASVSVVFSEV